MQYGTAFQISSMVSRIAFGRPGKLKIRQLPRTPPTCLESIAVGTNSKETALIVPQSQEEFAHIPVQLLLE